MRTPIAWRNVIHDRRRTLAATSGVAFAILLVFMQLGFYTGARTSSTMLYDAMRFDAILLAKPYVHMRMSFSMPRARLDLAGGIAGVADVVPVYVSAGVWRHVDTKVTREILVMGVDPDRPPFALDEINRCLPLLKRPDTAVVDQIAKPLIGPHGVGTVTEINGHRIEVVGDYRRGSGLICDGIAILSDLTFARVTGQSNLNQVQLGLVRFVPGADPAEVLERLRQRLADEMLVWSPEELMVHEQHFFMRIKPIGFMFTSGLYVAFLVGAVILYQVLSADIAKHLRQYATLKAMGYGPRYLYGVVMMQGLLLGALAYVPALVLGTVVYFIVYRLTDLPMFMTLFKVLFVFGLSVGMCMLAGVLAVRKVNAADPADLF